MKNIDTIRAASEISDRRNTISEIISVFPHTENAEEDEIPPPQASGTGDIPDGPEGNYRYVSSHSRGIFSSPATISRYSIPIFDNIQNLKKKLRVRVKASLYTFGSPRVGNPSFAVLFKRIVPDSFRTVVDGDVVTSVPPSGYRHVGIQALVDNLGTGTIILDPSFIERRLRMSTKSSVSCHSLLVYRQVSYHCDHVKEMPTVAHTSNDF